MPKFPFKLSDLHGGCGVLVKVKPLIVVRQFKLSDIPGVPKRT